MKITLLALATLAMTTFSCQRATLENHTERLLQLQGMWGLMFGCCLIDCTPKSHKRWEEWRSN
ncbi:MAG: hypothetical protein AAFV78_07505, partial [Bacteroidota bacterium]